MKRLHLTACGLALHPCFVRHRQMLRLKGHLIHVSTDIERPCACTRFCAKVWCTHEVLRSCNVSYEVATIRRLLKMKGLFFAEYSLFYRALLHKRPMFLRSLLIEATPYVGLFVPHIKPYTLRRALHIGQATYIRGLKSSFFFSIFHEKKSPYMTKDLYSRT